MAAITQEILITGTHFDSENKICEKIGFFKKKIVFFKWSGYFMIL